MTGRIRYYNPEHPEDEDNQAADIYNTARWRRLSKRYRAKHPLCETCLEDGRTTLSQLVHHVIEVRERPDLAFEISNLRAECRPCHNREHNQRRG